MYDEPKTTSFSHSMKFCRVTIVFKNIYKLWHRGMVLRQPEVSKTQKSAFACSTMSLP